MYFNSAIFPVNVSVKFLNFQISYAEFVDKVAEDEPSTHNKGQFGGYLIKISQILSILQRL